jgi:Zn-finger nucleic acid-binding protein
MIVVEHEAIELDWCCDCGGVWFDAGEIEVLLGGDRPISGSFGLPPASEGKSDRRCPRCRAALEQKTLGTVVLDVCPRQHGVWFDAGEVSALAVAAQTPAARAVVDHLVAMFQYKGPASP